MKSSSESKVEGVVRAQRRVPDEAAKRIETVISVEKEKRDGSRAHEGGIVRAHS